MFLKPIYFCFISCLLLSGSLLAQQNKAAADTVNMDRTPFIRIGVDPSRYLLSYLQPAERGGYEVQVDMEIYEKFYPVVEFGYMFARRTEEAYALSINGTYARLGFDYNLLALNDATDRDLFFVGWRMARSQFVQSADNVYYENAFGSVTTSVPQQALHAYWGEVTVGVKAEVFRNFFVGWTGRLKYKFRVKEAAITPYAIPGYGRPTTDSDVNADISLYLSYSFSLKKWQ